MTMRRRRTQRQGAWAAGSGPRVIVAGAGFAGISAVDTLARSGARVTLLDRNPYSTFQPLLYQLATAGLTSADVAYPARALTRKKRARFRHGELAGLDREARLVRLGDGATLEYDYLVLATGVSAAYFGVAGAEEHGYGLYTRADAIRLRDRLLSALDELSSGPATAGLSVTIVGGGFTGVEYAGTLAELRNIALPASFPDIDPARLEIRLIERGPALLAPYVPQLRDYARRQLQARGIEIRLDTAIKEVSADRVLLADGTWLPSQVSVWAAGVSAPAAAAGLGLPRGHGGRILVTPDLRVTGDDRIFAAGDIALIDGAEVPQLAQPAIQQGRHAARQILRLTAGQPTVPFSYHDKGTMATIGHRSAVVELPYHVRFRGTLAWLAWLGLHLVTLLGNRNRISALINLSWRYLTWSHGGGILLGDQPDTET
jgi:NADH:ubiquinone reductase (H+-translocating)